MRIGKLNRLVAIERRNTQRENGSQIESWEAFLPEVWANITDLSARDFIAARAAQDEVTTRIVIRWRDDIDSTMRVRRLNDGTVYAITGEPMEDNKGGRRYLTLMCSRGVANG